MDIQRRTRLGARFKAAGSSGNKAHVVANKGHWVVFKEGAEKIVAEYPTKIRAVQNARKMLQSGSTEMIVLHKADGTVEKVHLAK